MDKMMSREFWDCLDDKQKVKIIDKYCSEHYFGKAEYIPAILRKCLVVSHICMDEYLLIQIK